MKNTEMNGLGAAIAVVGALLALVFSGCSSVDRKVGRVQFRAELIGYEGIQDHFVMSHGPALTFDRVKLRLVDPPEWKGREITIEHEIHFRTDISWLKIGQEFAFGLDPYLLRKAIEGNGKLVTSQLEGLRVLRR